MIFMSVLNRISNFFKKNTQTSEKEKSELKASEYIGKFVKQNNIDIGESIAVDGVRFIVKNPDGFKSIPLEAVVRNAENIVVGDFNRDESLSLGKEWFEKKDTLKFDEKGLLIK